MIEVIKEAGALNKLMLGLCLLAAGLFAYQQEWNTMLWVLIAFLANFSVVMKDATIQRQEELIEIMGNGIEQIHEEIKRQAQEANDEILEGNSDETN